MRSTARLRLPVALSLTMCQALGVWHEGREVGPFLFLPRARLEKDELTAGDLEVLDGLPRSFEEVPS